MQQRLFNKILVANRGEIAVRVMKTIQEMGMQAVALASDADLQAEHVRQADAVIHLPGEKPADTYLQGEKIVQLAKAMGVDAVHPGYGFLSENATFAEACQAAGITFIGPSPQVIRDMGDKIIAKTLMQHAGVPVVPGWAGDLETDFSKIAQEAGRIGYPLLVKAAAGGGGKGMRLVHSEQDLESAFGAAAREAQSAFGDARVFLEKYISKPRHVEFQIFGDSHGNVVHLFERECSIQRRHQKIIEESPSPALNHELRERMGTAAVKAAQAMGYTNAGTVEFIVSQTGEFYFLEVNTRLQVEHPVTELVTQLDLVRLQIQVAAGRPLPFQQSDLRQTGHALECRIYAEDPARNFMPGIGKLAFYRPPTGPFIRLDSGVREGSEVTVHYDPMLAKLIVWGSDRQVALQKMSWALSHFVVLGVPNNVQYLKAIVDHPAFGAGALHTHFLEEHGITAPTPEPSDAVWALGTLSGTLLQGAGVSGRMQVQAAASGAETEGKPCSPWGQGGAWRALSCQK